MNSTLQKRLIIVVGLSFCVMTIAIVIGFFIFNRNIFFTKNGEVSINSVSKDNLIYLNNSLPMGDERGKSLDGKGTDVGVQGYLEFTIKEEKGKNSRFAIVILKKKVAKEINGNYIKLYLTDIKDNALAGYDGKLIPTFNSLEGANNDTDEKILFKDKIKANEEKKYKLRVWLSDTSAIEKDKKEFKIHLDAKTY